MAHIETKSPRLDCLDSERIRRDFPILQRRIRDHPLVYLDSAATTQKPEAVIDERTGIDKKTGEGAGPTPIPEFTPIVDSRSAARNAWLGAVLFAAYPARQLE